MSKSIDIDHCEIVTEVLESNKISDAALDQIEACRLKIQERRNASPAEARMGLTLRGVYSGGRELPVALAFTLGLAFSY